MIRVEGVEKRTDIDVRRVLGVVLRIYVFLLGIVHCGVGVYWRYGTNCGWESRWNRNLEGDYQWV